MYACLNTQELTLLTSTKPLHVPSLPSLSQYDSLLFVNTKKRAFQFVAPNVDLPEDTGEWETVNINDHTHLESA